MFSLFRWNFQRIDHFNFNYAALDRDYCEYEGNIQKIMSSDGTIKSLFFKERILFTLKFNYFQLWFRSEGDLQKQWRKLSILNTF